MDKIKEAVKGLHLKGGFTVLYEFEPDANHIIIKLLKEIGIDCIFTPRASYTCSELNGIKIISYPYYPVNGIEPDQQKDILYSFVGQLTSHPVRRKLATLNRPPLGIVKNSRKWFAPQSLDDFKNLLAKSRFSLCPRGYAPNSIRFWESLQAGSIPVLIADTARLPEGFEWDTCCIRIPEKDIAKIPDILKQISPETESEMRRACLIAHSMFSGHNIISPIRRHYGIPLEPVDEIEI